MNIFIILVLIGGFNLKWVIDRGVDAYARGRVMVERVRVGVIIFFTEGNYYDTTEVVFYRYDSLVSGFIREDSIISSRNILVWASGDFDRDGYLDFVAQKAFDIVERGFSIYESPDSFSYPKNEVWRDTQNLGVVKPFEVYDIDRDGRVEIYFPAGDGGENYYIDFTLYENVGDNSYVVKYQFESPESSSSSVAFGDFDLDDLNEFIFGTIDGRYSIFESDGNDSYIPLGVNIQLPTVNIFDCFSVKDMDLDGKNEFIVKGFIYPWNQFNVFIFEAIGDNQYQIKKQFNYQGPGNDYIWSYSCSGDVDSDSVEEAILLTQPWIRILKAKGDNNFYVWDSIYIGPYGGSVAVYDIDRNGIKEIIWSGNDITKIYEWDGTNIKENLKISDSEFLIPTFTKTSFSTQKYRIFNITGRLDKKLKKGIYFIKTKKKTFKIIKIR